MFSIEMIFSFALFAIGLYGVSSGRDFLRIFFSLEMLAQCGHYDAGDLCTLSGNDRKYCFGLYGHDPCYT